VKGRQSWEAIKLKAQSSKLKGERSTKLGGWEAGKLGSDKAQQREAFVKPIGSTVRWDLVLNFEN
jgi:hypothetical protein